MTDAFFSIQESFGRVRTLEAAIFEPVLATAWIPKASDLWSSRISTALASTVLDHASKRRRSGTASEIMARAWHELPKASEKFSKKFELRVFPIGLLWSRDVCEGVAHALHHTKAPEPLSGSSCRSVGIEPLKRIFKKTTLDLRLSVHFQLTFSSLSVHVQFTFKFSIRLSCTFVRLYWHLALLLGHVLSS